MIIQHYISTPYDTGQPRLVSATEDQLLEAESEVSPEATGHRVDPMDLAEWIASTDLEVSRYEENGNEQTWWLAKCPWNPNLPPALVGIVQKEDSVGAGCKHEQCSGKGWKDLLAVVKVIPTLPLAEVWSQVRHRLGEHVAFLLEVGASTAMSICLNDITVCPSTVFEGPAGSGKTTTIDMLKGCKFAYHTDNLTQAAFVSQYALKSEEELKKVDLLPRIRHRVLMFSDLAPFLGNREEQREQAIGVLIRLMDGQGYSTESGTQGHRGYEGDYMFGLLTATTPLTPAVWAKMGPRLLVLDCTPAQVAEDDEDELWNSLASQYKKALQDLKLLTTRCLDALFDSYGGYGAVSWGSNDQDEAYGRALARVVMWLRDCRAHVRLSQDGDSWQLAEEPLYEDPKRLLSMLWSLARGHALMFGPGGTLRLATSKWRSELASIPCHAAGARLSGR